VNSAEFPAAAAEIAPAQWLLQESELIPQKMRKAGDERSWHLRKSKVSTAGFFIETHHVFNSRTEQESFSQ